jgi:hypothetical protein
LLKRINTSILQKMKHLTLIIALVLTTCLSTVFGQDCKPYFPMSEGAVFEITSYKSNGKATGSARHTVLERTESGSNITVKVRNESLDKKGKEVSKSEYTAECKAGIFLIDFSVFMNNESVQAYENMEMTVTGQFIDMPRSPRVGDELNEGDMKITVKNQGIQFMTMSVRIYDRKVEALEQRVTPAGTYDCVKISYKAETTIGGIVPLTVKSSAVEWFAEDVGMVRSESYNNGGKMVGYSELTTLAK